VVCFQATLSACQDRIEQLLNNNVPQTGAGGGVPGSQPPATSQTPSTPASKSSCRPAQPTTPTDVRDVRVCH